MFKKLKQRGQVLVFYALLLPTLFMFVGAAADFGWYYLNVSRLQNAADAAVLAGAQALVEKNNSFENYYVVSLATNDIPKDFDDYKNVSTSSTNYQPTTEKFKKTLKAGRDQAEKYARVNLSDDEAATSTSGDEYTMGTTDSWNSSKAEDDKKVTGTLALKYKSVDGKNNVYGPLYYVVNLHEKIRHFLLPGWFDAMDANVRAVVLLRPRYLGLIEPMQELERTKIIDNWEYAKKYNTPDVYAGKWNHYQAGVRNNNNLGILYRNSNAYRSESVFVTPSKKTGTNVTSHANNSSSGDATDANGGKWYNWNEVDSINIDFRAEILGKFNSDWDLGQDFKENHTFQFTNDNSWSATDGAYKRILFNAEFDEAFEARTDKIRNGDKLKTADPLWVRIEREPIANQYNDKELSVNNFNSVRQITLNFNADNTSVKEDANGKYYEHRPYVIFYTGPEHINEKTGMAVRHSQPVVINLNANLNAIIYMPESPVIINGNNKTWHGFIIAKCFLQPATETDITGSGFLRWDGFNEPSQFSGGCVKYTDGYDNELYFKPGKNNFVTHESIVAKYPALNFTLSEDDGGTILVTERLPEYPVISFPKAFFAECTTLDEYFARTAEYIKSVYTDKIKEYAAFRGIAVSEVSMIKFPDEENATYKNFTAIEIPVATADLLDEDPDPDAAAKDDKYVKVMLGDTPKYIAKSKLPHVRIKRNANYPYVCIYDLKTGLGYTAVNGFSGVRVTDDSIAAGDSAVVFTNSKDKNVAGSNQYGDVWAINKSLLEDIYDKQYQDKDGKLIFSKTDAGFKYFTSKADVDAANTIAKYRKVGEQYFEEPKADHYLKDGEISYYMKVYNNDRNHDNYIIVDQNGEILTKPVTAPEVLKAQTRAEYENLENTPTLNNYLKEYTRQPNANEIPGDDEYYVGSSAYRKYEDYRIPVLERVYKKSTFGINATLALNEDSCYSYFDIEDLWRVNYLYMNVDELNHKLLREKLPEGNNRWKVDDMFFTYKRAKWID